MPAAPKRTRCTHTGCRKLAPPGRKRCDDHKPGSSTPKAPRKIMGCTEPRWFTPPLRPLNRKTSLGFEVIEFARMIGEPLLPFQEFAAVHALELLPDGTFRFRKILVKIARQNGKSSLKRVITLWRMYMYPRSRILGIAQDVSLARDQWNLCQETIAACPDLAAEMLKPRNVNGDEMFWITNGSRYAIKAANRRAGRGGSNDEVNIDELREQYDWDAYAAVSKTTMAKANSQIWMMTNEGDDRAVVLSQLSSAALAGRDPLLCMMDWSAEPGCDLDNWDQIAQANPALGYLIDQSSIASDLATDPPNVFRTEVLCQRVDHLDSAVDPGAWQACSDRDGTLDGCRDRIAACLDVAIDGAHVTLAVAGRLADGRVRVEIAGAWDSTTSARAELPLMLDRIKPVAIGWFPSGPAAALAPLMRGRRGSAELAGGKVTEACQGLADLTQGRGITHGGDPLLDSHIGAAQKVASGDGWRFTRRGGGHVDAAYAAAGAVHTALTMPEPQRARIRILA
jgi:hypothetical protein